MGGDRYHVPGRCFGHTVSRPAYTPPLPPGEGTENVPPEWALGGMGGGLAPAAPPAAGDHARKVLRPRNAAPINPKPAISSAQVAGSGTAVPVPLTTRSTVR